MSKTNEKFKKLSFFLCFILIFDFLVLNFGIKPKEVKAAPINISSARVINYDLRVDNNYLVFDFSNYLTNGETIEDFVLKKGNTKIDAQAVNNDKKAWKSRFVLVDGDKYDIQVTANIGGQTKKLFYQFVYNNYDLKYQPSLNFKGNDLEIIFNQNWLDLFDPEDNININLQNQGSIINEDVKVKDLKTNNNKKTWDNKKSRFGTESGYMLDCTVKGRLYRRKVFTYGQDRVLGMISLQLKSGEFKDDRNVEVGVLIRDKDITLKEGDVLRRISGKSYTLDMSKKIGTCVDSINMNSDVTMRLDQKDGRKYEGIFDFCLLRMIEKLNFSTNIPNLENNSINIDLTGMQNFLSKTDSKNKLYIYEMADNFTKGTKFGEKLSEVKAGVNSIDIGNKSFNKTKSYLVELTNGTYTISTPFIYTPMNITTTELKETSAKIGWTYPEGYTPVSEDKIEIFLRDTNTSNSYSSIANKVLIHGSKNTNLTNVTSAVVEDLVPGANYEVKVVLKNQNGSIVSYENFATKGFRLKEYIKIKDSFYDDSMWKIAYPRSKTITVEWDFEPSDMHFSSNDKVEIWVKPNTTSEFSGYPQNDKYNNPLFSRTGNLNSTKSATITIPRWLKNFHVDLIYTIGGKKIITSKSSGEQGEIAYNRRTVNAKVNKPKLEVTDETQTSAKIKWDYDKNGTTGSGAYKPQNGHVIEINVKKINSMNDHTNGGFSIENRKAWLEQGKEGVNLESTKELQLDNLEVGQCYRVRLRHILQQPQAGEEDIWDFVEEFLNFETGSFSIENLKAEQISQSPKVKLTWGTSNPPMFGEGESEANNIKVYLKEGNTSEYPTEPLKNVTIQDYTEKSRDGDNGQQLQKPTKQCEIELPKYNTRYNVKVEYTLKGKKIEQIAMAQADGDIKVSIPEVNNSSVTIKCDFPEEYKPEGRQDNIKLKVVEQGEGKDLKQVSQLTEFSNGKLMSITSNTFSQEITGLSNGKKYDVQVEFINNDSAVSTVNTSFKADSTFQIVALVAKDITMNNATLSWDYVGTHEFQTTQDKLDIFIKDITKEQGKQKRDVDDNTDIRTKYKKIIRYTHQESAKAIGKESILFKSTDGENHSKIHEENVNLKNMKSTNLKNLEMDKEYSIQLQYMKNDSGEKENGEPAEVIFKTMSAKFDATVFTSNQTTATFGWEYPKGYQLQENDRVEIFIKEVNDFSGEKTQENSLDGYGEPLLKLINSTEEKPEEGKYNLNEVTRVDVSGLTPERKYKARVKFTMNKGTSPSIETEANISTKSFSIKSFEVDSYQEYDILAKWEIEPENMMFSPADKLEIFVKVVKDGEEELKDTIDKKPEGYPEKPAYKLTTDPKDHIEDKTIFDTFSDYVLAESLGVKQRMLLVYTVGGKEYYKELEFINTINPVKAEVTSVDQTRALIGITAPDNYEFVDGDKLLVYAKDEFAGDAPIESDDFLVFEGVQSETLSIPDDMRMIELSYLLPEAKYEVLVALDLEDGTVEPAKLEFTTTALPVSDIKLESLKHDSAVISWDYGEKEIDFFKDEGSYDFTDKLIIVHKEADGTAIPDDIEAIKKFPHVEYLGEDIKSVKDADIKVEDPSKDYDVAVCYDLGGLLYKKNFKTSYLSVKTDEESVTDNGIKINWKYPSNITFGDGDKTEVFIRKKDEANYPEAPSTSSTGSGTVSYTFDNLEGETSYVAKVQITKEGLQIDPVEVEFQTKLGLAEETVIEDIQQEIVGTEAQVTIPGLENLEVKEEKLEVSMGNEEYKDFKVRLTDDGTGVIIEPTIPKKVYKNIEVTIPLEDGSVRKIIIAEFVTQPADVGQDWLSNAYKFAFDRFPDEGGYSYWYNERIKKKTMSGEYFLMNLLFGEDEFTNRNLGDKDLIAALYQIVVNRDYDEEGLNFWVGIYNENLGNAQGNKKLAQEVLVDRMVHEAEFGKLCENIGIFWTKAQQEAAGVPM